MSTSVDETSTLATRILNRVEELVLTAERETKPLELDPLRSELFELFVTANGAGYTNEDAEPDLSANGLCRSLRSRWGVKDAAKSAVELNGRIPTEHLAKMRLLWSLMRMWMEWSYAWDRWAEFHQNEE